MKKHIVLFLLLIVSAFQINAQTMDTDFSGKTIIPFNTHGGYGTGKSVNEIREFAPKATVLEALSINGNSVETAKEQVGKFVDDLTKR